MIQVDVELLLSCENGVLFKISVFSNSTISKCNIQICMYCNKAIYLVQSVFIYKHRVPLMPIPCYLKNIIRRRYALLKASSSFHKLSLTISMCVFD